MPTDDDSRVKRPPYLLLTRDAVANDIALQPGNRGARKILVTRIYPKREMHGEQPVWTPPGDASSCCSIQEMKDTELAYFTNSADQDRHHHKIGTEIYTVLEGEMLIEMDGTTHALPAGDTIVVNPGAVHEVKPGATPFLCQVITVNCLGTHDKYTA